MQTSFIQFILKSFLRRQKSIRFPILLCSMTVCFIFLFSVSCSSIEATLVSSAKRTYGSWNFAVYHATQQTSRLLSNNLLIDQLGKMDIYGEIKHTKNGKVNYIGSIDAISMPLLNLSLEQGRYPTKPNEVVLERELLLYLGIPQRIGNTVTLTYATNDGNIQEQSFVLCGIMNAYHNTYLKQGPLVSAFVSSIASTKSTTPISTNYFGTIDSNYDARTIVNELQYSNQNSEQDSQENWCYNSYLTPPSRVHTITQFTSVGMLGILLVSIYRSFLYYYIRRSQVLQKSHPFLFDKKRIRRFFHQECLLILGECLLLGCLLGYGLCMLMYLFYRLFYPDTVIMFHLVKLFSSLGITLVAIGITIELSRIHSYYVTTHKPTLDLPQSPKNHFHKPVSRFLFLLKRYTKVYKKSIVCYILLYILLNICVLFFVKDCVSLYRFNKQLSYDNPFDYSIMGIENYDDIAPLITKIKALPEVDLVSNCRYVKQNGLVVVCVPDVAPTPPTNTCCVFLGDTKPLTDISFKNNIASFQLNSVDYNFPIQQFVTFDYPNSRFRLPSRSETFVYVNPTTFDSIVASSHMKTYYFVRITYYENCDPIITSNIIDSLLFGNSSLEVLHSAVNIRNQSELTIAKYAMRMVVSLSLFFAMFTILRNYQHAALQYLQSELRILWHLGLPKHPIRCYFYTMNVSCHFISTVLTGALLYLLDMVGNYSTLIGKSLDTSPQALIIFLCSCSIYFIGYWRFIRKDLNSILSNF